MAAPQTVITANGPAAVHSSDFSLVTFSKPATAGEILSLFATGLGPVTRALIPASHSRQVRQPAVNSPVEVMVNGKAAEVLAALGYPGAVDGYK